ncbi:MAG: rpsC [Rickettsiaceae bacterium]|nr:rpsC [Rickettsiaceae bacterium]
MGQKARPIGLRVGINRTWDSCWYAVGNSYAEHLHQDLGIRKYIEKEMHFSGISKVVIERSAKKVRVLIHTSRPGVIIGKKGSDIEKMKKNLSKIASADVSLNIVEVRKPEADAKIVAEGVAQQLEKRVSFRRAMKRAMQSAMRLGAKGIRINVSGRLGGAEIARMEWYREGRVPLHTLRADIDYGTAEAVTTYGIIGVKVWIYKGDIYNKDQAEAERKAANDSQEVK